MTEPRIYTGEQLDQIEARLPSNLVGDDIRIWQLIHTVRNALDRLAETERELAEARLDDPEARPIGGFRDLTVLSREDTEKLREALDAADQMESALDEWSARREAFLGCDYDRKLDDALKVAEEQVLVALEGYRIPRDAALALLDGRKEKQADGTHRG